MLSAEELQDWRSLVENVRSIAGRTATIKQLEDAVELYDECLQSLLTENDEDFYVKVSKPPGVQIAKNDPKTLDLHFVRYQTDSTINALTSLFDVARIEEESNRDTYQALFRRQLDICRGEVDGFSSALGDPKVTIEAIFGPAPKGKRVRSGKGRTASSSGASGPPLPIAVAAPPVSDDDLRSQLKLAVNKLAVLKETATLIVDAAKRKDEALKASFDKRRARALATGTAFAEAPPKPSLLDDRLKRQSATFQRILDYLGVAKKHLSDLADALSDQEVQDRISDYLTPLAGYYERQARRPLSALGKTAILALAAILGSGSFAFLLATLFPMFGPLSWSAFAVSTALAFGGGFALWRGSNTERAVTANRQIMQDYINGILGVWPEQRVRVEGKTLSLLDLPFNVTTESEVRSAPPAPVRSFLAQMFPHIQSLAPPTPVRDDSGLIKPVRFAQTDDIGPSGWTKIGAVTACILVALLGNLVFLGGNSFFQSLSTLSAEAQIVQLTAGREACEVARGHVVWQTTNEIYLARGTTISAINRNLVTQVRYSDADPSIHPCRTQDEFYGKEEINISPAETKVVPVVVPVPIGGGPNVTVATVPIQLTLPQTDAAPPRTILQFYSDMFIDGKPHPIPNDPEWNYVILPVFADPVTSSEAGVPLGSEEYATRIHQFATCMSDLSTWPSGWCAKSERKASQSLLKALEPLSWALWTQRQMGCDIRLDVRGYASAKEFEGAPDTERLNLLLAEGRRVAVLLALGFDVTDGHFKGEHIEDEKLVVESPALGRLIITPASPESHAAEFWPVRFAKKDDMVRSLDTLLYRDKSIAPDPDATPLAEAFKRSVVVAINSLDLASCPPTTVARADG